MDNNSIRCYLTPILERPLVIRDGQLGFCLSHYLVMSFQSPPHMYIFEEVSTVSVFYNSPQIVFNITVSPKVTLWKGAERVQESAWQEDPKRKSPSKST